MAVRSLDGGECTRRHAWHGRRDFHRAHPDDLRPHRDSYGNRREHHFRHRLLVRRSSAVPEEPPDQYSAGYRPRNRDDNGSFNRSSACRNPARLVSVFHFRRDFLYFRAPDAGETP